MRYYSDVVKTLFDSVEEVTAAETKYAAKMDALRKKMEEEQAHKQLLAEEKETRKKEVDNAFELAYKLREQYMNDYKTYSYLYSDSERNFFEQLFRI